jgi:acyl-coenzyme A thioesterase PaaI-like protein
MTRTPHSDFIRSQVLRGIAGNRVLGLHFPGYFLDMQWHEIAGQTARVSLPDGPHCRDASGEIDLSAVAILADTALATSTRLLISPGARLATIHMQIQFTGMPATGDISAQANLLGFSAGAALHQSLTSATLRANGKPLCHATGEFVLLDPPPGVKLAPLPWQRSKAKALTPLAVADLEQLGAKLGPNAAPDVVLARQRQLQLFELENRQKMWRWLILVVLGLVAAETILAGRLATRSSAAAAPIHEHEQVTA